MSAKVKLISFISAFVLVLGIMIIGVLSAEQVKVNIGGSVSFNATNVYAKVSGNISGAETGNKTFSTLTYSASETTGDESDWTNLALKFTETPDPIEITITVENLSTQRTLTANLTNSLSASGLNIAVTRDSGAYASGTNFELPASTGEGSSTTTFTLTLAVDNPNQDLTDATFGYTLNMFDESVAPVITSPASDFTYTFDDSERTATIASYTGSDTEVVIPTTVSKTSDTTATEGTEYTITGIGDTAFSNYADLTSIIIPDNVTSIGGSTFYRCTNLASVSMPSSLTSIGSGAFSECSSLTSITIPEGVTSIGDLAFDGCSGLTSVTIPEGVTIIDNYTFAVCSNLASITILGNVTSIGDWTFSSCISLTSITIPDSVISIGSYAFYQCTNITSFTIGESVETIGESAFRDCYNITSITLPSSVTSIEENAFYNCSNLSTFTIHAITPPTLGGLIFNNVQNIYVPAESLSAYQSARNWSIYSIVISAIQ